MKKFYGISFILVFLLAVGLAWGQPGGITHPPVQSYLDPDTALTANSDSKIATQKAVKAFVGAASTTGNAATATALSTPGTTTTVLHGNASGAPSYGPVDLSVDTTGVTPAAKGGSLQGTTTSSSGPVSVTTALSRQTFVATDSVQYNLPTGDLSGYIGAAVPPLQYAFVNLGAGTKVLTINPGAGNFIANGAAAATFTNTSTGTGMPTLTLRLISSAGSVNKWAIMGADETWVPSS